MSYCLSVSRYINNLKNLREEFRALWNVENKKENLKRLMEIKREGEEMMREFERNRKAMEFMRKLENEELRDEIKEYICGRVGSVIGGHFTEHDVWRIFEDISDLYEDVQETEILDQKMYDEFVKYLIKSRTVAALADKIDESIDEHINEEFDYRGIPEDSTRRMEDEDMNIIWGMFGNKFVYSILHSIFLNKFMTRDGVINIDRPPRELESRFGCYLEKGKFNIGKLRNKAGLGLSGATLNIKDALEDTGMGMADGTIRLKDSYLKGGVGAEGGVMFLEEGGPILGHESRGKSVIIANKCESFGSNIDGLVLVNEKMKSDSTTVYYYDHEDGEYKYCCDGELVPKGERLRSAGINDLYIYDDPEYLANIDVTIRSDSGILVLLCAPEKNIGKGMRGGAVIIEDENLTPEEARKRLSWEDRTGGIILMRVPDEENPGKTKLIDLEDPFLEEE